MTAETSYTETQYTDEDIQRSHDAEPIPKNTGNRGYSAAVMDLFSRAKEAGKKNELRSRKINASLRAEREAKQKNSDQPTSVAKPVQRSVFDF